MSTISQFDGEDINQHIREAELLALLKRRLTPVQTTRIQNHLPGCKQCHELYQDANDFCLPRRAEEVVVSEAQIQASWDQLKPLLRQAEPRAAAAVRPVAMAAAAGVSRSWALPLAAVLFLILSGVSVILWRNRQAANVPSIAAVETSVAISKSPVNQPTPSTSQQASGNTSTTDPKSAPLKTATQVPDKSLALAIHDVTTLVLTSGEKGDAGVTSAKTSIIPAKAKQLRFRLTKYKPTEFPSYQVELLDEAGKVKQVVTGSLAKDRLIEAIFQRNGLRDGKYQLRVTGQGRADADLTPLTTDPIKLSFKTN
jgi:hypothetical protein